MESLKEKAKEAVASAEAGMERTKATVEEKREEMKTTDEEEKSRAEEHKPAKKHITEPENKLARTDGDRIATDPI